MPQRQHRSEAGQPVRSRQPVGTIPAILNFNHEMEVRVCARISASVR
jgi:hypothetical protein